ncbi:universal stress protein [Pseudonocardia sp. 73-21]|uniref:universal stress protein n=1 Tax=Pseudonocardia sp. 73-21 TaxID=1895809 RepID=UPI00095EB902|nr:universal stress protein [Pseudonocardia sp. 73-21]OJY51422.1 MAG: hypothetical protein BGP03_28015 [Pseudonocardia sp. 73-21]
MATDGDFHPVLAAEKILATALTDAGVSTDVDTITTAPVQGQPAEVLIEMAQTCELLVVGSRRHGKVLGALLGSISHYLAGHAPCLIVVVKPPRTPATAATNADCTTARKALFAHHLSCYDTNTAGAQRRDRAGPSHTPEVRRAQ